MQADNNWAEISTDQRINAEGFLEWKLELLLDYLREGEKVSEHGMENWQWLHILLLKKCE